MDSHRIFEVLAQEINFVRNLMADGSQQGRRVCIRSTMSFIEGMTFKMKHDAWFDGNILLFKFTPAEISILSENTYEVKDDGDAVSRPLFINIEKNIRFTFKIYTRIWDSSYEANHSDHRWGSLKKSIAIRNRITHPKSVKDLEVTEENLKCVMEGFDWFNNEMLELMEISSAGWKKKAESK